MSDLKLAVTDIEDLTILSSVLQDATVLIGDMGYDESSRQFLMVAARYISSNDTKSPASRRLIGVNFDGVNRLYRRGFSPNDRDNVLNLLAIRENGSNIEIIFSGEAMLRLECEAIKVYAADLGEGWATQFNPGHDA
jgi:hypothetical protein